jgi:MFS family permease
MVDQAMPSAEGAARNAASLRAAAEKAGPYAYYALALLVAANFFNYVDRQIVSILAHGIQKDLGLTDAKLGFILGTAFAVLYGVVGVAMGRISDALSRTKMMASGLALWSGMTALSGLATNFTGLAAARIGVGVGEATANPCSHSLLSDYFPARNRSAVLGTYLVGTHLGGAGAFILGGYLLQNWATMCQGLPGEACAVSGWRAAFFAVGIPGLLLSILLFMLREPPRPSLAAGRRPMTLILKEMSAAVPPFTLYNLFDIGGWSTLTRNLVFTLILVAGSTGMGFLTGDWAQWIAVAIGLYSVTTWAGVLKMRDRPMFALTFGCPTFVFTVIGAATIGCLSATVHVWSAPYMMRTLGTNPAETGLLLGVVTAVTAATSAVVGGYLTDKWKQHNRRAPAFVALFALVAPAPALLLMMRADGVTTFMVGYALFTLLSMPWSGGIGALIQDLALPRMRGTASAAFSLIVIVLSSGLGPYWAGKISTLTGSLTTGLYSMLLVIPIGAVFLLLAASRLPRETPASRLARAQAAGEPA